MATNNVIKEVEIKSANNLSINKLLGAEAQNIDVGYDANGEIIEDITVTTPTSTGPLSTALKQIQGAVIWAEENVLGAKNLIPIGESVADDHGIAYTVATNGAITLSGTATAESTFEIELPAALNGTYTYTIDCANLSTAGVGVSAILRESDGSTNIVWFGPSGETDGSKEVSVPANSDVKFFTIVVSNGASVSGLVIKPMLRLDSIKDRTYVPYAKTNKELTDDIAEIIDKGAGHTIKDATGTALTQRSVLAFKDSHVVDNGVSLSTDVEVVKQITSSQLASLSEDGIYETTDESDGILSASLIDMAGYSKPVSTAAIVTTDTASQAIGKLEKKADDTVTALGVWTAVESGAIGDTTITITNSAITTTSHNLLFIDTVSGVHPTITSQVATTGQIVITFNALEEAADFQYWVLP